MSLAQGHNTGVVGIEPRSLDPESDTLPLCHCAPLNVGLITHWGINLSKGFALIFKFSLILIYEYANEIIGPKDEMNIKMIDSGA